MIINNSVYSLTQGKTAIKKSPAANGMPLLKQPEQDTVNFSGIFSKKKEEKLPWVVRTAAAGNWQALHDAIKEGDFKHTDKNIEAIEKGIKQVIFEDDAIPMVEAIKMLKKMPKVDDNISFTGLFNKNKDEKIPWVVKEAILGNWQPLHCDIEEGKFKNTVKNKEILNIALDTAKSTSRKQHITEALEMLRKMPKEDDNISFTGLFNKNKDEKLPWVVRTAIGGNWQALSSAIKEGDFKHTDKNIEAIEKGIQKTIFEEDANNMRKMLEFLKTMPKED